MTNTLTVSEITHYTNLWCRQQGIHAKDLENHPQADDVVLLVKIRQDLWHLMDSSDRGVWSAYWDWTYYKAHHLKKKHLTKLDKIIQGTIFRQQRKLANIEKIKAIRAKAQTKTAC